MRRQSETFLLVPLLPIFLLGMFPVLIMALLGVAGLALVGILLISAGLTDALDAKNDFNQHIVVEGYAGDTQRAIYASDLRSSIRSATVSGSPTSAVLYSARQYCERR